MGNKFDLESELEVENTKILRLDPNMQGTHPPNKSVRRLICRGVA